MVAQLVLLHQIKHNPPDPSSSLCASVCLSFLQSLLTLDRPIPVVVQETATEDKMGSQEEYRA